MPDRSQLGLARIARETVQDRVYSVLRDRLMRGGFEPGQKLKIAELARGQVPRGPLAGVGFQLVDGFRLGDKID